MTVSSLPTLPDDAPAWQRFLYDAGMGLAGGDAAKYRGHLDDPLSFCREVLSHKLWDKQAEVVASVGDSRYTVVEAGHGVGKSFSAAELVCWWMSVHEEAIALTIAPTHSQVQHVLWPHIRGMARGAGLSGEVLETPRWRCGPRKFAIGLSPKRATQEDVASMQGYHSPNLLVILDEAPGLPRILWDAVKNLAVGENNRILAIGNPIAQAGPFWDACQSGGWRHVRMSCLDHPNVVESREVVPGAVSRAWVEEMVRDHASVVEPGTEGAFEWPAGEWHLPDAVFQSRVLGVAPGEDEFQLVALSWVITSMSWAAETVGPAVVGMDPARYGGDEAAMVCRRGPRVLWVETMRPTTPDPSGEMVAWMAAKGLPESVSRYYVDEIGLGAGVVDKARSQGLPVVGVVVSRSARHRRRFFNLRAELGWTLRERLREAWLTLPQDDMLAADLTATRYRWMPTDGRFALESKVEVRKRLGRSPNRGDALMLTFADWRGDDGGFEPFQGEVFGLPLEHGRWAAPAQNRPPVAVSVGSRAARGKSRWRR